MKKEIKHLKITCEHCGCVIDLDNGNICPNCGAVFDSTKQIERYNELQDQMNQIKVETAEAELEGIKISNAYKKQQLYKNERDTVQTKKISYFKKILCTCVFIYVAFIVLGVLGLFISGDWKEIYKSSSKPIVETEPEIIEQPIEVQFNETAELIEYSVICDKIEEYHYPWIAPQEGFYYVKLHLIVTNKTDKKQHTSEEIICRYKKDNYMMAAKEGSISSDDIHKRLYIDVVEKLSSTDGWVYYEVPINTDLILIYDDYITINIPAENIVMLENS